MFGAIIRKFIGSKNEREMKRLSLTMYEVNDLEASVSKMTDAQLAARTPYFREKLVEGAALEDIMPEAFAVVREAARRTVNMRPFDVQILGGLVLHEGKIVEMKTGEGYNFVIMGHRHKPVMEKFENYLFRRTSY